jgi:hypothetical protein
MARAYLPNLPVLSVHPAATDVTVSWPSSDAVGFGLEQANALSGPANWITNTANMIDDGTNMSVTFPATNGPQFYRLRRR